MSIQQLKTDSKIMELEWRRGGGGDWEGEDKTTID